MSNVKSSIYILNWTFCILYLFAMAIQGEFNVKCKLENE